MLDGFAYRNRIIPEEFAVTPEMAAAWVDTLPSSRILHVGSVTVARMERLGIRTGADLSARSMDLLIDQFVSSAGWYHAIARQQDDRPVNPHRTSKSSESEATSHRDLTEPAEIEAGVLPMADEASGRCEERRAFGRTVTVGIKFQDCRQVARSRSRHGRCRCWARPA